MLLHDHVVERQHGMVTAAMAEFDAVHGLAVEAVAVGVNDKRGDALALELGVDGGEQQHDVGDAGVGDPVFLTADAIAAVGLFDGVRR